MAEIGLLKGLYRYLVYGKQVGKTAANGSRAYARGGRTVAMNAEGEIYRTTQSVRTGKYTYKHTATNYLPFGKTKNSRTIVERDGKHWRSTSRSGDSPTLSHVQNYTNAHKADDGTVYVTRDVAVKDSRGNLLNERTETVYPPKKVGQNLDTNM